MNALPTESAERKDIPLARGVLDYFPAALVAVAKLSQAGNEKHNPGEELHHARGKSNDHADCILRHLVDRNTVDPEDGIRHSTKVAWRALALLQEELEAEGAPLARGARLPEPGKGLPSCHNQGSCCSSNSGCCLYDEKGGAWAAGSDGFERVLPGGYHVGETYVLPFVGQEARWVVREYRCPKQGEYYIDGNDVVFRARLTYLHAASVIVERAHD